MGIYEFKSQLKNNQTEAEGKLWQALRGRKLAGLKFRRQHIIGDYILDFYCAEIKLCIEVDGKIHESTIEEDQTRDMVLNELRVTTLRIKNEEINNIKAAIKKIKDLVKSLS